MVVFTPNYTRNNCEQKVETDTDQTLPCSKSQRMCLYNLMDLLRTNDISVYQYYKTSRVILHIDYKV